MSGHRSALVHQGRSTKYCTINALEEVSAILKCHSFCDNCYLHTDNETPFLLGPFLMYIAYVDFIGKCSLDFQAVICIFSVKFFCYQASNGQGSQRPN